jgi:hypothetical protein
MKPSKQLDAIVNMLTDFPDNKFNREIQVKLQDAWTILNNIQEELEEAGI